MKPGTIDEIEVKMCGAMSILSTLCAFLTGCDTSPVSNTTLGEALGGVRDLIEAAYEDLREQP